MTRNRKSRRFDSNHRCRGVTWWDKTWRRNSVQEN